MPCAAVKNFRSRPVVLEAMHKYLSALRQLGLKPITLYGLYKLGLKLGMPQRAVTQGRQDISDSQAVVDRLKLLLPLPEKDAVRTVMGVSGQERLSATCAEILAGKVRLFGAEAVELRLAPGGPLLPWDHYENGKVAPGSDQDIKFTWEPGRLGWAFTLGRGYYLSGDERYSQAFWENAERFIEANPPYLGAHWSSAQEVALRLIALAWSLRVFLDSPASIPERQRRLVQAIADHAARIPPTLLYARSQNNNHLLSEAAGLYTAGLLLEGIHPRAAHWRKLGWRWFQQGIQAQVAPDGSYCQHSANYQRLMLQLALWINVLQKYGKESFNLLTLERLDKATRWLAALLDNESGKLPNLGPNDGAYIFPLTGCPFDDYRPVLQAAARVFCHEQLECEMYSHNDELSLWLGCPAAPETVQPLQVEYPRSTSQPLKLSGSHSWATLRAVHFHSRPGHADQLHLDLWWRGLNLAQDAGTYRYTACAPWDNALTHAAVHNTVTVDGLDQMRRAGRFLYLDWAQAEGFVDEAGSLSARHAGYQNLGILHSRRVTALPGDGWVVEDRLTALHPGRYPGNVPYRFSGRAPYRFSGRAHTFCLHWLLPDWPWQLDAQVLTLESPLGRVSIKVDLENQASPAQPVLALARAGERIYGSSDPAHLAILGWVSPTYSQLQPALSLVAEAQGRPPVQFTTTWTLPNPEMQPEKGYLP
jgi:hypothetical protein